MTEAPQRERLVRWSDPAPIAEAAKRLTGLALFEAMARGEVAPPPILALLGVTLGSLAPGRIAMRLVPGEQHHNPIGTVHGGIAATLLDSVMGCAVHSTLPAGRGYTTLEIKVSYLRAVTLASGELTAEGWVAHGGRQAAFAEARLTDAAGRLCATATSTCLLFDLPKKA